MKIRFGKKKEPTDRDRRKEWLISEMEQCQEYLKRTAPGSDDYQDFMDAWKAYNAELTAIEKADEEEKFHLKDILPWVTAIAAVGTPLVMLVTSLHKDKTRKELGELAYKKEELDGELSNGKDWSLATKE